MTRTVLWLLALTLATVAAVQQGGVGTLAGRVVRAGTSEGIPDALVTFVPAGGTDLVVTTDSQGRFVFENVPAGTGRLNVRRDGYFSRTTALACLPTAPPPPPLPSDGPLLNTASQCVTVIANQRNESEVQLIPGGTIRGLVLDIDGKPAVNTQVTASPVDGQGAQQTVQTNDRGEFRIFWVHPGQYTVGALPRSAFQQSSLQSPAATYFPATVDEASAAILGVGPGADVGNINFSIRTAPTFSISGRVISSVRPRILNGVSTPAAFTIGLWPDPPTPLAQRIPPAVTRANGEFVFRGIRPGRYQALVTMNDEARNPYTGRLTLVVDASDVENVTILATANVSVSGRVAVNPVARLTIPLPPAVGLQLTPQFAPPAPFTLVMSPAIPDAAGAFKISGVPAGKYTITPPSPFYAAEVRGTGVEGTVLTVGDGVIDGLEVVLDETGTVTGILRNAEQQPASRAVILLMPDRSRRQDLSLFKTAVTNAAGRFFVNRILPGDYILSVWDGPVSSRMFANADFLDRVEGLGVTIHITAGSTLDLQSVLRRRSPDFRIPQGRAQPEVSMQEIVPVDASQASIEGRAWNGQNRAAGAAVVLIPDASRRGNAADYKTVATSATGYFVFRGNLSGQYTAMAFESLPPEAPQSPEFLSKYAARGRVVSFSSAGSVSVQLNTIPR